MQIKKVKDKKSLNLFLKFTDKLYKKDEFYVPYMKADLKRTLTRVVLVDEIYTALILSDGKNLQGRILYTVDKHKQFGNEPADFFLCSSA